MSEWKKIDSHPQYSVSRNGVIVNSQGKEIGQWFANGYFLARLSNPRTTVRVHRIVAQAFVPNPHNKPVVNHIDCDTRNNNCNNLEWVTQPENLAHSDRLGRMRRDHWKGKPSPNRSLCFETAKAIRNEYKSGGTTLLSLAKKYGTNKRTVGRIVLEQAYVTE